jgi:hypothetical protein
VLSGHERGQGRQKALDLFRVIGFPSSDVGVRPPRNMRQQIHPAKQGVNFTLAQLHLSLLGGDKAIFHRVGNAHGDVEVDNPGGAFERVGSAHEGFELSGRSRCALQLEQAGRQDGRLVFSFHAEKLQHG